MHPSPYLFFAGDCYAAMSTYAEALGGKIGMVLRNSDLPLEERLPGPDDLVMNMSIETDGGIMFGSDHSDALYQTPQGFRLHLQAASLAEFDRLYAALSPEARALDMPPEETFWAERFAMFTDRFGTPWMLDFTGNKA